MQFILLLRTGCFNKMTSTSRIQEIQEMSFPILHTGCWAHKQFGANNPFKTHKKCQILHDNTRLYWGLRWTIKGGENVLPLYQEAALVMKLPSNTSQWHKTRFTIKSENSSEAIVDIADTNWDENYTARNRCCLLKRGRMIYVGRSRAAPCWNTDVFLCSRAPPVRLCAVWEWLCAQPEQIQDTLTSGTLQHASPDWTEAVYNGSHQTTWYLNMTTK